MLRGTSALIGSILLWIACLWAVGGLWLVGRGNLAECHWALDVGDVLLAHAQHHFGEER